MKRRLSPRQVILFSVLALVVIIALTIGGSILLDRLGVVDPNDPYSPYWMLLIGISVVTTIAAIVQISGYSVRDLVAKAQGRDVTNPDHLPGSDLFKRNRQVMLQQVREFWVKGVFEHSLYQSALLSLGKAHRPDLVTRPWNLVMKTAEAEDHVIPRSTEILELYDQSQGSVLILGAPGSGKTTTLLELTRDLLARAERDETHPMPVVFSLSSWSTQRGTLVQWMVEELHTQYDVSRKMGAVWVEHDLVLPLLDGLDEVRAEDRGTCVEAINAFRSEHGHGAAMVVCSRTDDYEVLSARLRLRTAILLQPLTPAQIEEHLEPFGSKLDRLRQLIQERSDVQELAAMPLMLGIMMVVYQDSTGEVGPGKEGEDLIDSLFEEYVQRMLERPAGIRVYVGVETKQTDRRRRVRYSPERTRHWLGWLAGQLQQHNQSVYSLEDMQTDWLRLPIERRLVVWGVVGLAAPLGGLLGGLVGGLLGGLLGGLFGGLVGFRKTIKTVETLHWRISDWRVVLLGGLSFGLIGALGGVRIGGLSLGLLGGLSFGLVSGLVSELLVGLQLGRLSMKTSPNQGMQRSLRSGLVVGLLGGLGFGLVGGLRFGLVGGLGWGLFLGLTNGLLFGWRAYVQHTILRLLLWRNSSTPQPWEYVRFLDDCSERVLLHKVGGGYRFIHRMLMEWFARQPDAR